MSLADDRTIRVEEVKPTDPEILGSLTRSNLRVIELLRDYEMSTKWGIGCLVVGVISIPGLLAGLPFFALTSLALLAVFPLFVWNVAIFSRVLHAAWSAIQDGKARTAPDQAVGFLFVPIYNLYWLFVAIAGYRDEFDSFCRRNRIVGRYTESVHQERLFSIALLAVAVLAIPFYGFLAAAPLQWCMYKCARRIGSNLASLAPRPAKALNDDDL